MMEETSQKEYAALAQLSKANRRSNQIFIALVIVLFLGAVLGGWKLYSSQQDAFKKRTAANNATQQQIRVMVIESIRYQTCIGVVPIELRTPEAQRACFHKADLPGGLTEADFITVPPEIAGSIHGNVNSSPSKSSSPRSSANGQASSPSSLSVSSSPQSAPSSTPTQPNNSQNNPPPSPPPPSYTECVSSKSGILGTIGGVVGCL